MLVNQKFNKPQAELLRSINSSIELFSPLGQGIVNVFEILMHLSYLSYLLLSVEQTELEINKN